MSQYKPYKKIEAPLVLGHCMSELGVHNRLYSCELFGLVNTGTLCYLNSLVQALASCSEFVKLATAGSEKNDLCTAIAALFNKVRTPTTETTPQKIKCESSASILSAIQKTRVGHKSTLGTGTQEDVFEGMKFLIEGLGSKFENIFSVRYKNTIRCTACNKDKRVDSSGCPAELMINMSDSQPILQKSLTTQAEVEKYIRLHMLYPDDYRCEFCKAQNLSVVKTEAGEIIKNPDGTNKKLSLVQQFYSMSRVSSILMMSFHDNHQILFNNTTKGTRTERVVRFFPNEIRIKSKTHILVYRVVAQIEQYGSLGGGHYIANCLRPRPAWLGYRRIMDAQKAIKDAEERLVNCHIQERINELKNKLAHAERVIQDEVARANQDNKSYATAPPDADLDKFIDQQYAVYKFNDSTVTYDVRGFVPTSNTYLVFYHLFQEIPVSSPPETAGDAPTFARTKK
jgi:ubiquitin C-terminal hydrolase